MATRAARTAASPLIARIRADLVARADPARAVHQQRYMKSAMPYWGLTADVLRKVVRSAVAECGDELTSARRWEATIRTMWDGATHREERYAAVTLARHPRYAAFRTPAAMPLYQHLIVTGAWWDLVDETATHLVREQLIGAPAATGRVIRGWATGDSLWLRRAAIICQVGAKQRTDVALLADVIVPNLEGGPGATAGRQDFFIRKAIGWALRDYSYTDPAWVGAFVARHAAAMSGLTIREASKHLSGRVT